MPHARSNLLNASGQLHTGGGSSPTVLWWMLLACWLWGQQKRTEAKRRLTVLHRQSHPDEVVNSSHLLFRDFIAKNAAQLVQLQVGRPCTTAAAAASASTATFIMTCCCCCSRTSLRFLPWTAR